MWLPPFSPSPCEWLPQERSSERRNDTERSILSPTRLNCTEESDITKEWRTENINADAWIGIRLPLPPRPRRPRVPPCRGTSGYRPPQAGPTGRAYSWLSNEPSPLIARWYNEAALINTSARPETDAWVVFRRRVRNEPDLITPTGEKSHLTAGGAAQRGRRCETRSREGRRWLRRRVS